MGSPSRNVQYHPPRLSEDRLNLPQPHSPSLPTHCSGKSGMRPSRPHRRDQIAQVFGNCQSAVHVHGLAETSFAARATARVSRRRRKAPAGRASVDDRAERVPARTIPTDAVVRSVCAASFEGRRLLGKPDPNTASLFSVEPARHPCRVSRRRRTPVRFVLHGRFQVDRRYGRAPVRSGPHAGGPGAMPSYASYRATGMAVVLPGDHSGGVVGRGDPLQERHRLPRRTDRRYRSCTSCSKGRQRHGATELQQAPVLSAAAPAARHVLCRSEGARR